MLKSFFKEIQHSEIIKEIEKYTILDASFFTLTILAAIIATLGLILDNVTIIIGAMIIAPLMWPILHVATGILRGSTPVISRGVLSLIICTVLSIIISIVVSLLTPITQMTDEILLRTAPNILDLVVALCSGAVAALALNWPKISSTIAGVAVAVALVPPLGVIGIGIAEQNLDVTMGATILYLTNLLAILFISVVIFRLMGFHPRRFSKSEDELTMRSGVILSSILVVLIAIPLAGFFIDTLNNSQQNINLKTVLSASLKEIDDNISVKSFQVYRSEPKLTTINAILHAPPYIFINKEQKNNLSRSLAFIEEKNVEIDLEIIPVVKAGVELKPGQIKQIKEEKQSKDKILEEAESLKKRLEELLKDSEVISEMQTINGINTNEDNDNEFKEEP